MPDASPTPFPIRGRIPCLDGLRAFSILLVFITHTTWAAHLPGSVGEFLDKAVYPYGITGVGIFFVLSGYLITHLLVAERHRNRGIDLLQFYRRRILRIFPPFYTYLLVICALCLAGALAVDPQHLLHAATFTQNLYRDVHNVTTEGGDAWYVAHFWSLAYEEQYYLVWPAVLLWLGPARAIFFPLAWIIGAPFLRLASHGPPPLNQPVPELYRFYEFLMLGSLAALCEGRRWFEAFFTRLPGLAPAACAVFLLFGSTLVRHWSFHHEAGLVYELTFEPEVDAGCVAVVLLWLVRHADSAIGRLMEHPAIVYVGVMSYSLYVWQQLVISPPHNGWIGAKFPFNIILALVLAEVSFRFVEKPFRQGKPPRPAAPATTGAV